MRVHGILIDKRCLRFADLPKGSVFRFVYDDVPSGSSYYMRLCTGFDGEKYRFCSLGKNAGDTWSGDCGDKEVELVSAHLVVGGD